MTASLAVPVKPPPPALNADGSVPESWEEVANFDAREDLVAEEELEHTERLYRAPHGQFVLVRLACEEDDEKIVTPMTRPEAARWFLSTLVPEELRGVFAVAGE